MAPDRGPSEKPAGKSDRPTLVLAGWVTLFLLLTLVGAWRVLPTPFSGPHSGVSAHFCVMARTFAHDGLAARGFVPLQNNPPYGRELDLSTHWPPLFTILLSLLFQVFGATELTARGFMLLILLGNATLIFLLLRRVDGTPAGLLGVLAFLAQPIVMMFGLLVIHLHLAIFFTLAAGYCLLNVERDGRRWGFAAVGLAYLAVWTSWEPLLFFFCLWLAGWWFQGKSLRRWGLACCAAALLAIASVFALYFVQYPDRFLELTHVVRFRLGLQSNYAPGWADTQPATAAVLFRYWKYLLLLEPLSLLALGTLIVLGLRARRALEGNPTAILLGGWFGLWAVWFGLLRGHGYFHEYQLIIALPVLSLGAGLVFAALMRLARTRFAGETVGVVVPLVVALVVPFLLSRELAVDTVVKLRVPEAVDPLVTHGRHIRAATPADAVVLSPYGNMLVAFYAQRHQIRDVKDDDALDRVLERADALFASTAPVYLALLPSDLPKFSRALSRYTVAAMDHELLLLAVRDRPPPAI
ncbi:MAG: hypothetical protein GX444_05300 [Myxococcales bacterium]|nr:hypothetical protein [Myxococcales bacterium]